MYIVNEGYAFTSKRGMLKAGDEITVKDFSTQAAFDKAVENGKIIKGDSKTQAALKEKRAAAEKAVTAAKEAAAAARTELEAANTARADAEARIAPARDALLAKEKEHGEIAAARKAVNDADEAVAKEKDPDKKAAAEEKATALRATLWKKIAAVPEIKTLADALTAAEGELEKATVAKTAAESKVKQADDEVAAAKGELEVITAELAALEGK